MSNNPRLQNNVYFRSKGCVEELYPYTQEEILEHLLQDSLAGRELQNLFNKSAISQRQSVFAELFKHRSDAFHLGSLLQLSTLERNNLYRDLAPGMFYRAAKSLLRETEDCNPNEITHLITASCTGCYSPGPGEELIAGLGLSRSTERIQIGYMGCFAGLVALRLAHSICLGSPSAVVLIVCAEISSLHWRNDISDDNKISLSLFSDGSAAAIVSNRPYNKCFVIEGVGSELIPHSASEMAWNMGEFGFEMTLSRKVPSIIRDSVVDAVLPLLALKGLTVSDINYWAVHPGGKKILQEIENRLLIDPLQIQHSYQILREFGNMSSATIFFVLERVLASAEANARIVALAFGPGLTIEKALLSVQL